MHFKICPLLFSFCFLAEVWSEVIYLEQIRECSELFRKIKIKQEDVDNLLNKWGIEKKFIFKSEVDGPIGFKLKDKNDVEKKDGYIIKTEKIGSKQMNNFLIHIAKNTKVKQDSQDQSFTLEQLEKTIEEVFEYDDNRDGLLTSEEVDVFFEETALFKFSKTFEEEVHKTMFTYGCAFVKIPEFLEMILPEMYSS